MRGAELRHACPINSNAWALSSPSSSALLLLSLLLLLLLLLAAAGLTFVSYPSSSSSVGVCVRERVGWCQCTVLGQVVSAG